jgi:N-dimethylarginine dimethylaminohydrolase
MRRFYHLDTCLCPLASGYLLYFPAAFDEKSRALIELLVPKGKRVAVEEAGALEFCCNAVDLDGYVFMNDASENLRNRLRSAGFTPVITPLSEFMKATRPVRSGDLFGDLGQRRIACPGIVEPILRYRDGVRTAEPDARRASG